jgi:hypothetical protein
VYAADRSAAYGSAATVDRRGSSSPQYPLVVHELLTGGCLCGGVRFEVSAPLESAGYCHCTRCQRRTGTAASVQGRVASGSFRVVQGEELVGRYEPASGGFAKEFCSACGGALWSRDPSDPEIVSVRLGAFDRDPGVRPSYRQFVAYAAPWEAIPDDGLPRFAESRA